MAAVRLLVQTIVRGVFKNISVFIHQYPFYLPGGSSLQVCQDMASTEKIPVPFSSGQAMFIGT